MPVTPTYPGVYIEEVSSGVRTISGVATSITGFVGYFSRGPLNEAVRILSISDFERTFGGLRADSLASYAIDQFFLNGGSQALVVRTAKLPISAAVILGDSSGMAESLKVAARSEGLWGKNVRIDVDYGTMSPSDSFNLRVREVVNGATVNTETFLNLTMTAGPRNVVAVINDGSKLIRIISAGTSLPSATGTTSKKIDATLLSALKETDTLTAKTTGMGVAKLVDALGEVPTTMNELAATLQARIRNADPQLNQVLVSVHGSLGDGAFLSVRAGTATPTDVIELKGDLAASLGLDQAANVQEYQLDGASEGQQKKAPGTGASDGSAPGATEIETALKAFDKVDLFNILCLPDTSRLDLNDALAVIAQATAYCEKRRAFYVVDVPQPSSAPIDEPAEIENWLSANSTIRHKNLAIYYPRPLVADPLDEFRLRAIPSSGTIAGLYARTDSERGVWKAPAGLDARLRGVQALEYLLTDDENGVLNPLGVNCLRNNAASGNICWGARTLVGSDLLASEWKYVPVRRLALFLEESLYRGTQWVVFEPNDEPLWSQIRLNLGAFLHSLFRQGAFQGQTSREAYLVKCDKETTTQDDINRGIVNIVVGFAPLKPAEFVILKIQQLAGQIAT